MDAQAPLLFDPSLNPPSDSILGSKYLDPGYWFGKEVNVSHNLLSFLTDPNTLSTLKIILSLLAIFFLSIIFYTIVRLSEIRRKEAMHLHHELEEYKERHKQKEQAIVDQELISKNERWRQVLQLLFSESANDWKLSVIEADAMLETLLENLGFAGDSLGDRLKKAGEQGFQSLNNAWEVHNIRNRIAHEGSIFELSHREAKRAIAIYEQIFREFGYI